MSTVSRTHAAALAVAVVATACTTGSSTPAEVRTSGQPGASAPSPREAPSTGDPPGNSGPSPSNAPTAAAMDCDAPTLAAIDAVVTEQLSAFVDRDWTRALTFASQAFRSGMSASQFETIITGQFPVAAAAVDHTTDQCATDGTAAQAQIQVAAADGRTSDLVYMFVLEAGNWRIGGAAPAADSSGPSVVA